MNNPCTWKGCGLESKHSLVARDGEEWAHLCEEHKARFDAAPLKGGKEILAVWVLAQGGASAALKRF